LDDRRASRPQQSGPAAAPLLSRTRWDADAVRDDLRGDVVDHFADREEVAVCVVVARQVADADGTAQLRLPPALLADHPTVVLVGPTSGTVALSEGAS
jgi:hypothetical protein